MAVVDFFCTFNHNYGMNKRVVTIDPEIMSGAPVFAGTRVPVQTLIDCLKGGETIDEFLYDFPTVRRDLVNGLLDEALAGVIEDVLAKSMA